MKLKSKDLLGIEQLTKKEIEAIFRVTEDFKRKKRTDKPLSGKTLAMIFEKPSTRTRVSFECAIYQLGGLPVVLNSSEIQLSRGETIPDTARVLSGYVDGITIRTFEHRKVVELAKHASVPVINALSDFEHPCQALADLYTIYEKKGLSGIKIAYVGDGDNNVTNSLIFICALMGIPVSVASPKGYQPKREVIETAKMLNPKAEVVVTADSKAAVVDADVIYTDVWVSMGAENEAAKRKKALKAYQLNKALLNSCGQKDYLIMHCLPAHRGDEITDEVMESKNSVVFAQAENRMHVQKAVLYFLLGGKDAN